VQQGGDVGVVGLVLGQGFVLGINVVRSVILSLHVFNSFEHIGRNSFSLPMLWGHSMRTGAMARTIAQHEALPKDEADYAYIAALLHDVGKLLMEAHCPEECLRVYDVVRAENRRVAEVEAEQLGLTHAEVGAYLLGLWGLPTQVVHAVADHHAAAHNEGPLSAADIVHFANLLDHEIFVFNEHYAKAEPSPERLDSIGGPERYAQWRQAVLTMNLEPENQ